MLCFELIHSSSFNLPDAVWHTLSMIPLAQSYAREEMTSGKLTYNTAKTK